MTDEAKALVERLRELERDLKPFAHKTVGSIRIDLDEVRAIVGCPDLIETQAREIERLRGVLQTKHWPPTDAELREMLAQIVGAWWSESSANNIRTAKNLKREDIKGMYAVRDALAPYIARAALAGDSHDQ